LGFSSSLKDSIFLPFKIFRRSSSDLSPQHYYYLLGKQEPPSNLHPKQSSWNPSLPAFGSSFVFWAGGSGFFFGGVATKHLVNPFLFTFFPSSSPLCKTQTHTHTYKQKPHRLPILSSSKIQLKTKKRKQASKKAPKKASKSKKKKNL
jgi:hypothetical protein